MDGRVTQLIAALNNPQVRRRFATVALADAPVDRSDDDRMLLQAGVFRLEGTEVAVSREGLATLLQAAREMRADPSPKPLEAVPRRARQRAETLEHLADAVFAGPDTTLSEREVGDRLAALVTDVALFRRAMVDDGFVERDAAGTTYWRAGAD